MWVLETEKRGEGGGARDTHTEAGMDSQRPRETGTGETEDERDWERPRQRRQERRKGAEEEQLGWWRDTQTPGPDRQRDCAQGAEMETRRLSEDVGQRCRELRGRGGR